MKNIYSMAFVVFMLCFSSCAVFSHEIFTEEDLIEKIQLLPYDPTVFTPIYLFLRDKNTVFTLENPEKIKSLIRNLRHASKNSIDFIKDQSFIPSVLIVSNGIGCIGVYFSLGWRSLYNTLDSNTALGVSLLAMAFSGTLYMYMAIKNRYFYELIEKYDQLLDTF